MIVPSGWGLVAAVNRSHASLNSLYEFLVHLAVVIMLRVEFCNISTEVRALIASAWIVCVVKPSCRHNTMKTLLTAASICSNHPTFQRSRSIIGVLIYQKRRLI